MRLRGLSWVQLHRVALPTAHLAADHDSSPVAPTADPTANGHEQAHAAADVGPDGPADASLDVRGAQQCGE